MIGLDEQLLKCEIEETLGCCTEACKPYCKQYINKYMSIKYATPKWLTISPKSVENISPDELFKFYLCTYLKNLVACSKDVLGVVEFANERMHFHIFLDVKDPIKYNIFVNTMSIYSMCRSYKGEPKEGIHYLFKEVDHAKELILYHPVIYTEEHLEKVKQDLILERKIELKERRRIKEEMKARDKLKAIGYISVPKWMQEIDSEIDSEQGS